MKSSRVHSFGIYMCIGLYIFLHFHCFKWGRGVICPLVSICALVSIYSYNLTVSNGGGGSFAFGIYMCSGLYIYRSIIALVFSYKLTILNGVSLMTKIRKEFTPFTGSFKWGSICLWYLYVHWSLYIHII